VSETTAVLIEPNDTARQIRDHCRGRHDLVDDYEPRDGESVLRVLCYPLSEAYYFARGKPDQLTVERQSHEGGTHWYLRRDDGAVIDLTLDPSREYDTEWFDGGQACGFLSHPNPSNRTKKVLEAIGWGGDES
jgi:hypothetical protein